MTFPCEVTVITVCRSSHGQPDFHICKVSVTEEEMENGDHYEKAAELADKDRYGKPYVQFDEEDAKQFPGFADKVGEWIKKK